MREEIISLHRYWICADRMRLLFYDSLKNEGHEPLPGELYPFSHILIHGGDVGIFMGAWYSYLYAVIEGYIDLKLSNDAIDKLISSDHANRLKRFRNATFHVQKEWLSPKTLGIFEKDHEDDHVVWIRDLHEKMGAYLLTHIKEQLDPNTIADIQDIIKNR